MAGPSSGGEGTSVASAGSVEMGIDGPRSRVSEETGSVLEDIPGTGGEETTAETIYCSFYSKDPSRNSKRLC